MTLSRFLLLAYFVSGCSGWNSEIETQYIPDPQFNAKPKCHFKLNDNCWTRSLHLITSCASSLGQSEGTLTDDLRFCSNEQSDFVEFINPSQIIESKTTGDIEANIYSKDKRCFHISRRGSEIRIDQTPYGEVSSVVLANGDVQVSCLFGESFVVPALVKERGCLDVKASIATYVPSLELMANNVDKSLTVSLKVLGTGNRPLQLFSCRR